LNEEEQLQLALKLSKEDFQAVNVDFDDKEALIIDDEAEDSFRGRFAIFNKAHLSSNSGL
jgi:hypothetical protein